MQRELKCADVKCKVLELYFNKDDSLPKGEAEMTKTPR
jgi:hypothetical protein